MHRAVCYLPNRKVLRGGNGCAQRGSALRGVRAGHRVPVARFLSQIGSKRQSNMRKQLSIK